MRIYKSVVLVCVMVLLGIARADRDIKPPVEWSEDTREIVKTVERIRQLNFKRVIASKTQPLDEFRDYVGKEVDKQFGDDGGKSYVAALYALGALQEKLELKESFQKLTESQAAAHYDPEKETYFLLMTNLPAMFMGSVASHELCHALQDQYFDLEKYMVGDIEELRRNGDAGTARQCVVEGEATYVMTVWSLMNQSGMKNPADVESMAVMALNMQMMLDLESIVNMTKAGTAMLGEELGAMGEALDELEELPRYLVESLYASYTFGAGMICKVKAKGGWEAVSRLYKEPPESTEQVLHPEKLFGKRDKPVPVEIRKLEKRLGGGWKIREEDVMGELGIKLFFRIWRGSNKTESPNIADASAGWGGDRYYYLERPDTEKYLLVWKSVWDTEKDAVEFAQSYRMTLEPRFKDLKKISKRKSRVLWEAEKGRYLSLTGKGKTVVITDTNDRKLIDERF